ncbi:sigma-70 family RNA polymerase sigma factor [Sorangium sp. So ce1024]|uniref:sigma-70 family RNA polymerase sigma factor n=1 Tax=Sorangium sp. So ce1024 TaxID=3133327 RepID=UPI003F07858C
MCCSSNDDECAAARARLFRPTLARAVLRWLERLRVPRRHRGDVAGQVWVEACESWSRFDPKRGSPERWLNRITVYVAAHYHERAQHRMEHLVGLIDAIDPAPDAAAMMVSGAVRTGMTDALNELDPKLRYVLVAHDLNGIPMTQIADSAGVPISTLYKRRTKALRALRDAFVRQAAREIHTQKAGLR